MLISFEHIKILRAYSPIHLFATLHENTPIERKDQDIASEALQVSLCRSIMAFSKQYGSATGYNKKQRKEKQRIISESGRTAVSQDYYDAILTIHHKFKSKNWDIFNKNPSDYHHTDFTVDRISCRANFGLYNPYLNSLINVKIARHAGDYEKQIKRNHDHAELAWAQTAINMMQGRKPDCYLIVIEMEAPFASAIYRISDEVLEEASAENLQHIQDIKRFEKEGYPSYFAGGAKII